MVRNQRKSSKDWEAILSIVPMPTKTSQNDRTMLCLMNFISVLRCSVESENPRSCASGGNCFLILVASLGTASGSLPESSCDSPVGHILDLGLIGIFIAPVVPNLCDHGCLRILVQGKPYVLVNELRMKLLPLPHINLKIIPFLFIVPRSNFPWGQLRN